ncbi:beta-lysine 5,6-aminomutase beta subunit [Alkalithermobacter thermoalcaliphilus JW-YL-7 = DSM 7308]|uniref:Beta-lysine 5,6-aminomutase beta subunit n=1 Tax=Alkalithermobacter thermoalcaliphilus JW-YL-7 = DSM 7308 TaxID=1121328 RepID=A0A150FRC8_CLOPD|nr:cobalamin B12-binding domain protein [[Clostridium] paradoxum JW-YL-7 = DSM 7308]SHK45233.1 beta-lysine 5,6-aminomutase beta subunit [[Clostridium] paradoxum JW-YL-7 = DSM 7308]
MGSGLYSTDNKKIDKTFDLTKVTPYGDTMNDGKVQISFTLPVESGEKAVEAAKRLAKKMGIIDPCVAYFCELDKGYTFFIIYGSLIHSIDYTQIHVQSVDVNTMSMEEVNKYIKENIKRKIVVIGASTGSDAHTVGIDAIMNMKGYAGHYGLERYEMIQAYNLGSQVPNEEFVKKAVELKADVLLVSQTVTQKDIHIKNLTNLVELLEAEGIREKVILICGGPRITHELAKELGYDAGFGPGKYADDVATFAVTEMVKRNLV